MPNGKVDLTWGDGEHTFNIAKHGLVFELQDKCGCGVFEIYTRLLKGKWYLQDLREIHRLGLIGGGKSPTEAYKLVVSYVDGRPWLESVQSAIAIMGAAMSGVPGDDVGKKQEAGQTKERVNPSSTAMADSSAPQSTASPQP